MENNEKLSVNDFGYLFLYWINVRKDKSFANFVGLEILRDFDCEHLYNEIDDLMVYTILINKAFNLEETNG